MKLKIVASVLIGFILLGASCSKTQSFVELTQEYRVQVDKLASEWDNANEIANGALGMQLATPLMNLWNIGDEYNDLSVPATGAIPLVGFYAIMVLACAALCNLSYPHKIIQKRSRNIL